VHHHQQQQQKQQCKAYKIITKSISVLYNIYIDHTVNMILFVLIENKIMTNLICFSIRKQP